jgi:hypothetical protein
MFNYLISGFDNKMQMTLKQMYVQSAVLDEATHRREMEEMKKEIADDVLSRITATVDVTEIIEQIEELRRMIEELGR